MTQTIGDDLGALRAAVAGPVIAPDDETYDQARSLWNGGIDRRPAVVVRCASSVDVAAALSFAQERGLAVTVRGGGHNSAGSAAADGAVMIDLSRLNEVVVDPAARRATAGGGATLAQLDAATQEHGLAVTGGVISHTGIGGLTLGGGMGWLTRRHGLAIDNLVGAEVVLADGRIVRASHTEHRDLFWALRGGGGNFGVVTRFDYQVHEVGPLVQVGMLFYGLDQVAEVLTLTRRLLHDLPLDLTMMISGVNAPPAPFVPEEHHFRPGLILTIVGFGSPEQHAARVDELRAAVPPLFGMATPMPYVALQQMLDGSALWGHHAYERALYLDDLGEDVSAVVAEQLARKASPLSMLHFYPLAGTYGEVAEDATAFGGSRAARFAVFIMGVTADGAGFATERDWVRTFWEALVPHRLGASGYVNGWAEYDEDRVRAVYGDKYDRLARIKAVYDPTNVFRANANITPA